MSLESLQSEQHRGRYAGITTGRSNPQKQGTFPGLTRRASYGLFDVLIDKDGLKAELDMSI